jgi:hypothetical protein
LIDSWSDAKKAANSGTSAHMIAGTKKIVSANSAPVTERRDVTVVCP